MNEYELHDECTEGDTQEYSSGTRQTFTDSQLGALRRQAAQRLGVPEAALVPARERVVLHRDPERRGILLFRLVGAEQGVCLVWEERRKVAVWLYERDVAWAAVAA